MENQENEKLISFNKVKWAMKKEQAKRKVHETIDWANKNRELVVTVMVPASIAAMNCIAKSARNHAVNKEIRFKERTIYDHSLGRYVELKRPLRANEALTIEERRANGEKLHMILNDMGLLK